ncbi:histone-fold-containing protein [Ascodesmis nigricans]|uniref:NCT transcriptional regulatory complex subunit A n=1 Tax=Ascodesmis nigricans TaxID=341454 RepID=A0A4S2N8G9_9PEZI|nr:histone-fold-containing protein [Ascodesmis nigricans]
MHALSSQPEYSSSSPAHQDHSRLDHILHHSPQQQQQHQQQLSQYPPQGFFKTEPPSEPPSHYFSSPAATNTPLSPPQSDVKPRRGGRRKNTASAPLPAPPLETFEYIPSENANPPPRNVNIKTKFPVARIKRIMQADEDVGKVAQVTPVVVSKALELFMVSLCDKASAQARSRNSKRITAAHLKAAIINEDQFDFLADIIEKIPDAPAAAENGNGSDEACEDEEEGGRKKRTRKPRTRKPKDE